MPKTIDIYQITTVDGVFEIKELDNGVKIESLTEPSEEYLQRRANEPKPIPHLSETEIIGQQLVEKDIQILELQIENQLLGQQIVDIDLRLLMGGI